MTGQNDHRELGYGNVDARPDIDGTPGGGGGESGGGESGGGESGGGARPEPVETTEGEGAPGGQTDPAYRGGANDNATRDGDGNAQ